MTDRQLKVTLIGDTKSLDRALGRTETRLKKFGKNVNAVGVAAGVGGKGGGIFALASRSNLAVAGFAAVGLGLRSMTRAAAESQVVLGQTGVAVKQAGIDWNAAASTIQAGANKISKASSFDDEAVLRSFQVFVRGQKDVGRSLDLSALAADVARGRYTDLESATVLVNKAAMGQVGALRRAGIQIDKNATSTQALAKLQQTFAGSAANFSKTAAGSADRVRVAWDNLLETLGSKTTNQVGEGQSAIASVLESLDRMVQKNEAVQQSWQAMLGTMSTAPDLGPLARAFEKAFGLSAFLAGEGSKKKKGPAPAFGEPGFKPGKSGIPVTQVSNRLVGQELDARLGGNQSTLKGVLSREAAFLRSALKDIRLTPDQENAVKSSLLGIQEEIQSIDDQIVANATAKTDAAKAAKSAMAAAHQRAIDALKAQAQAFKDQAQAFKDQADAIKQAVLGKLGSQHDRVNISRDIADAKDALRVARQEGGPQGIKMALRGLADANLAARIQKVSDMPFKVGAGPPGPVSTVTAGTIVFNINGNQSPEQIANAVIARLTKKAKQGSSQSRGTIAGRNFNVGV
jgi:hypothetical protein